MNLPSPQQLRYLVALADTLHFGQAADDCKISQPALSAQLARLERSLGVQLVERTTRRVLLTPAGKEAVERARNILTELEELAVSVHRGHKPLAGALYMGAIPTVAPYLLPTMLPLVRREFPELRLFLREEQTSRLLDGLSKGKLDVALLALPVTDKGLRTSVVADESFRLVVPSGHRLGERSSVDQRELADEEVLLLEDGHCFRNQALAVCEMVGARETSSIRANSVSTLVQMVANGLGVTLLPASAVASELRGMSDVVDISFTEPRPRRTLGLVWRSSSSRDEDYELLSDLLRTHIDKIVPDEAP